MICPKCFVENEDLSRFCSSCGAELNAENAALSTQSALYAGFWRRFAALLLDSIILTASGFIIGGIAGGVIGFVMGYHGYDVKFIQIIAGIAGYILGTILNWLYYTLLETSSSQATVGKMALGIKVTDFNGGKISFGRANGRYWGKIISTIIIFIGFIMAGFTEKKQALHDIMACTLVVKK